MVENPYTLIISAIEKDIPKIDAFWVSPHDPIRALDVYGKMNKYYDLLSVIRSDGTAPEKSEAERFTALLVFILGENPSGNTYRIDELTEPENPSKYLNDP